MEKRSQGMSRINRRTLAGGLLAVLLTGWYDPACAQGTDGLSAVVALEQSLTQLIEQTEPSVVSIARARLQGGGLNPEGRLGQPGFQPPGLEPLDLLPNQFAGGVIVAPPESEDRYVLTVYHAVRGGPVHGQPGSGDGSLLQVHFASRHVCAATIYAADPRSDLAVLKLEVGRSGLRVGDLRPIAWADSAPVRKGQLVVTLGNPYWIARDGSPSAGWAMIANLARRPASLNSQPGGPKSLDGLGGLIHLDTRLPIGASGSAVVNLTGQLVGITTSLAAITGYERSSGFALPIDPATRRIVGELLAGHEVEYGFLGITPRTARQLPLEVANQPTAALVGEVHDNSPAEAAGLRPGDLILAVDGKPVLTELDLMREVTLHAPETTARLTVVRGGGDRQTVAAKLGKWPAAEDEVIIAAVRRWPLWRGLGVDYSTGRAKYLGSSAMIRPGVLVTDVVAGSRAEEAMLQPGLFIGAVNGTSVRTPAEFAATVAEQTGAVTLTLISSEDGPKTVSIAE
jgi:serine protease Do